MVHFLGSSLFHFQAYIGQFRRQRLPLVERLGAHFTGVIDAHQSGGVAFLLFIEFRVGQPGGGLAVFEHAMLWERSLIVAAQVGILRKRLLDSLEHANSRRQFGHTIGANQYVAGRIVDLFARYRTSRLLVSDVAAKLAAGVLSAGEASLAKLYVSEAGLASNLDAFRILGGAGFLGRNGASTDLLDAFGGLLYSGTSDLQRVIVAHELGLLES